MGKEACIKVLKKNKCFMSAREIAKETGNPANPVSTTLRKLRKDGLVEVERRSIDHGWANFWRIKESIPKPPKP